MSGTLFQIKRSAKLKYKLAVRQAFAQHENRYDDELSTHFLNKQMPEFWKTWATKFSKNAIADVFIDGSNDGQYVACHAPHSQLYFFFRFSVVLG